MSKKSKFSIDDFDKKPKRIKDLKTGDDISFFSVRDKSIFPKDPCDIVPSLVPNLDIIKDTGRQEGYHVVYNADNIYNYSSQSQRYESQFNKNLFPVKIDKQDKKTVYYYCSSSSPTGFWEVTVDEGGIATYVNFKKNPLVIICPRPFKLSEVSGLTTDSTTINWQQLRGDRTVLIDPVTSLDPTIDIQNSCYDNNGCSTGDLSPIILRVNTGNELVFGDLYIENRLIDRYYGLGYSAYNSDKACQQISKVQRVPDYLHKAYVWDGAQLRITWQNPDCDSEYLTSFTLEQMYPPYTAIALYSPTDSRVGTLQNHLRYRIATHYNIRGKRFTTYSRTPIFYNFDAAINKSIFADDATGSMLGYSSFGKYSKKIFKVLPISPPTDTARTGLGYSVGIQRYHKISFKVQVIAPPTDTARTGLGYSVGIQRYHKIKLGGVNIG